MIMKGQKINDRYQIIKTIGEGGMANVYLAYDTILDRNVALKVLRGDLANDDKFVRRFQREALSASNLSHPNIVEVYDVGEDDGMYYIVMEYIEGKHLKQLLKKRGKLTVNEVIDIMLQVTDGMAQAHDSYIIHRDIKPQNIMILENGLVKITDFGIAMALNGTQLTQTNSVMGSVHYLPPEQAEGKGATIRSDIYSMGILMFELLTGTLPHKGDNAVEIALKQLKEPIPNVRDLVPDIPQSVENIIIKSTAKNPENRYADAREMHNDLRTVLDKERLNEPRYILPYPEFENKVIKNKIEVMKEESKNKKKDSEDNIAKKITEDELKKQNKTLTVLAAIFTGMVVIIMSLVLLLPALTKQKNVIVPDVTNKTVADAEKILQKAGFETETETNKMYNNDIESGKVIKTDPAAGRSIKEGKTITIYESLGKNDYTVEDFYGKNYIEIKTTLEKVYSLNVIIEEKDVENADEYEVDTVIEQTPKAGTILTAGDQITLYIPKITEQYPDFTVGNYSLEDIQAFADKYSLKLTISYQQTDEYEVGSIISQSRPAGTDIISGITLKIVIAEEVDNSNSNDEDLGNTD